MQQIWTPKESLVPFPGTPLGNYIVASLRRIFGWSPQKRAARKRVQVRNLETEEWWYECEECGTIGPRKKTHVDHVLPVIDPAVGFTDWNNYISRLFCNEVNLKVLCHECHRRKSSKENKIRRARRNILNKRREGVHILRFNKKGSRTARHNRYGARSSKTNKE